MTSLAALKDALAQTLERRGVLDKIKANVRAEIFSALDDPNQAGEQPEMPMENLLLNELFREYLVYNGYKHTLAVFLPETGMGADAAFDRSFIADELGVHETTETRRSPLMYQVLRRLKHVQHRERTTFPGTALGSSSGGNARTSATTAAAQVLSTQLRTDRQDGAGGGTSMRQGAGRVPSVVARQDRAGPFPFSFNK